MERAFRREWLAQGRPGGMQYDSYRSYKHAKYEFRCIQIAANEEYEQKCFKGLNDAAGCDNRLFWKMTKRFKPASSKVYPEIAYTISLHE